MYVLYRHNVSVVTVTVSVVSRHAVVAWQWVVSACAYMSRTPMYVIATYGCHPTPWLSGVALSRLSPDKPVNNRAVILSYRPVLVDRNIATLVKFFLHCRTPLYRLHQLVGL